MFYSQVECLGRGPESLEHLILIWINLHTELYVYSLYSSVKWALRVWKHWLSRQTSKNQSLHPAATFFSFGRLRALQPWIIHFFLASSPSQCFTFNSSQSLAWELWEEAEIRGRHMGFFFYLDCHWLACFDLNLNLWSCEVILCWVGKRNSHLKEHVQHGVGVRMWLFYSLT